MNNTPDTPLPDNKLLGDFYEKSVDAYHAFMGTYTDAESDETAPDRLIEHYTSALTQLLLEARIDELQDIRIRSRGSTYIWIDDRIAKLTQMLKESRND